MGYRHIENLYRPQAQDVLLYPELYAMEKIHGTSAHIKWKDGKVTFFSGGEKHANFVKLFDEAQLTAAFQAWGKPDVCVYGEAYGGSCQGMKDTYGEHLRFIAFEVLVGDTWLTVPLAELAVGALGLEFVHYKKIPADLHSIDAERDAPSEQAFRNGCAVREDPTTHKIREGVVLRPLVEVRNKHDDRVMAKHKHAKFGERLTPQPVDPAQRKVMDDAHQIALEFVTDMRLSHVLDKLGNPNDLAAIPQVIAAMIEDVTREASGEIVDDKATRKAISGRTVKLYKMRVMTIPEVVSGDKSTELQEAPAVS